MFESAELGHKIDDATYEKQSKKLRPELQVATVLNRATRTTLTVRARVVASVGQLATVRQAGHDGPDEPAHAVGVDELALRHSGGAPGAGCTPRDSHSVGVMRRANRRPAHTRQLSAASSWSESVNQSLG